MRSRSGIIAVIFVVGILAAGFDMHQYSQAQNVAPATTSGGRYQMSVVGHESVSTVFVLDSLTGKCWYRDTHHNTKSWTELGSPEHPVK